MNGSIKSANKSQLNTIHEGGGCASCPTLPPTTFPTCTIIGLIYSMEYNSVVTMWHCMIACNIMRVSASSRVAHSEVTSWPAHDTTLFASKKPPLMPISLPTSRVYLINWFDRKDYAPNIFWHVHNVLPVLLKFDLWHDIPWNHVWWSVLCICQIRHPPSPWYRHWTSLIPCFEWRYLLNHQKLKHLWVCQCSISTPFH